MMIRSLVLLAILGAQWPAWAEPAQNPAPAETAKPAEKPIQAPEKTLPKERFFLSLTDAIQFGLKKHQDVKVAKEKIDDAEWQVIENGAQGLPQLSLTASYGRQDPLLFGNTTDTSGAAGGGGLGGNAQLAAFLGLASVNNFSSRITLSQTLFTGFRIVDGVRVAQINVDMNKEGYRQAQQGVAFQVTNNYFAALRNLQRVKVDKESLAQAEEQERQAKVRLKAGTGVQLDVLQAQSQVIQLQQQTSEDLGNYVKSKMDLNLAMGREADYPIILNEGASVERFKKNPAETIKVALQNRPELKQLRMQKEMSDINATIQGRALWPTITAQAYYNLQDNQVIGGNTNNVQNMNYYINMNWPLFDGLGSNAKAQRAANTSRQTQLNLDKTQQQIVVQVQQALMDISGSYDRMLMARAGVKVALENQRVASVSYREGVGVMMDVLNANLTLLQSRQSLINANYDLNISTARLYQTMGLDIQPYVLSQPDE